MVKNSWHEVLSYIVVATLLTLVIVVVYVRGQHDTSEKLERLHGYRTLDLAFQNRVMDFVQQGDRFTRQDGAEHLSRIEELEERVTALENKQ